MWISFEQVHLTQGIFAGIKTSWITVVKMCSGFLIKSTIQWPIFLLFCFILISFKPPKVQRFFPVGDFGGWRRFIGASVSGDHSVCCWCVAGKSGGKGGVWCLQSHRKSYSGTCSTIFVDWELIIKCQMSWLRVFSSLSGSLSSVIYSLPPHCVFPGWCCCEKRQRGLYDAVLDHTCKKIPFLRTIFLVVVEELKHFGFTFWASSAGPLHRAVV